MAITRDRCDRCHLPFVVGENVYRYAMFGSAPEFDGVAGEQIFVCASCAVVVERTVKHGPQRERMILAHQLALSIREKGVGLLDADPHEGPENEVFQGRYITPLRGE